MNNSIKYLKELSNILENISEEENILNTFINSISKILNSDICFIDTKGNIINEINNNLKSFATKNSLTDDIKIEPQLINQLNNINDIKLNISLDNLYTTLIDKKILAEYFGVFIPVILCNKKLGTIIIYKKEKYTENLILIFEYIKSIVSILMHNHKNVEYVEDDRKKNIIKSAIDILSFSELEAIIIIFEELNNKEGILIASKIADREGITRSVIVNALRKFESAGIIESRSLGMKGTYIKILNEYLLPELKKFKK